MRLKGIDKFREKTQIFGGAKIWILPFLVICTIYLVVQVMIGVYKIPDMLLSKGLDSPLLFLIPLLGELIICAVGLILVYQMWAWKDRLRKKYGHTAYKHIFFVGFLGIACMLSIPFDMFVHYWSYSPQFWADSPFGFLAVPPEQYFVNLKDYIVLGKIVFSVFFAALGFATILRSLFTFGFDYMTVIYLYYPEESKMQDHKIYSVLRHPTYAGAVSVALGGMFSTLTLYSIIFFIVYFCAFYVHVHFVEEKELITRFGQSYKEYMKKVPAFVVHPNKIGVFINFLLGKS